MVRDNSVKELRVYVDGELRNTTDVSGFGSGTLDSWLCFGSDYHSTPLLLDGRCACGTMYVPGRKLPSMPVRP